MRCSICARRSSSSSHSSRVTRPSSRNTPCSVSPARSPTRIASPRQRFVASSMKPRTSSLLIPPRWASESASSSARSAVSATAPTRASASRLTGSSMGASTPALPALLALRGRSRRCRAVDRRNRCERRSRLLCKLLLGLLHRFLETALRHNLALAPCVLGLPLLEHAEERRRDEDRRVGTRGDTDHQCEREVLERGASVEEQRTDRQKRDERRGQRPADRLPQRDVRDRRHRGPPHKRDVLPDAVEDDDGVV